MCGKEYAEKKQLNFHHKMRHAPDLLKFKCPKCISEFNAPYPLRKHLSVKHNVDISLDAVKILGESFKNTKRMQKEKTNKMANFVPRKGKTCIYCGNKFTRVYNHDRHVLNCKYKNAKLGNNSMDVDGVIPHSIIDESTRSSRDVIAAPSEQLASIAEMQHENDSNSMVVDGNTLNVTSVDSTCDIVDVIPAPSEQSANVAEMQHENDSNSIIVDSLIHPQKKFRIPKIKGVKIEPEKSTFSGYEICLKHTQFIASVFLFIRSLAWVFV